VQHLGNDPLSTGASAVYPYSEFLAEQFTAVSRFDDTYFMYRVFGKDKAKKIALPRRLCPIGPNDLRVVGSHTNFDCLFEARNEEQSRIVDESARRLIKGQSFITEAPTGFGKTPCALAVVARVKLKTLVVVTKEDARDHWYDEARRELGLAHNEIGFIQGDQCEVLGKKFVIGMIQSLSIGGRYSQNTFNDIGLTIWDEVHRVGADVFSNTCWLLPSKRRWGLSATPWRRDGKEALIHAHIGTVKVRTKVLQLIPNIMRVKTNAKFPKGLKYNGKAMGHVTRMLGHDLKRNHFIAKFVKKAYDMGRICIVFSDSLDHLDYLNSAIKKVGVPAKAMSYYVGGLTKAEREVAKGKPVILATYAYTSEATDIPWLDTMVMATPKANVVQIVGRVLREHPNKPTPLVLDLVDPLKIYQNFGTTRLKWYHEIGAEIKEVSYG